MKILEQILEEIKSRAQELSQNHWGDDERHLVGKGIQCMYVQAEGIIRSYMKDDGWIPVKERLPEEHKLYDITHKNEAGIHSDSAIFNPYLKRWLWDADETELVEAEVLAWAEKREPYRPKED